MFVSERLGLGVFGSILISAACASAAVLPAKDSGNGFSTYALGYSAVGGQTDLYAYTGDSIYKLDTGTDSFVLNKSGIRSAYGPPPHQSDGGFAVGPSGEAMAMFGFSGGNVITDLSGGPSAFTTAPDVAPPHGTDNFFSGASRASGKFYVEYTEPDFSSSTEVRLIEPGGSPQTAFAVDPPTQHTIPGVVSYFSGGIAFDSGGNLVVGVLGFDSGGQAIIGFYGISAAELNAFEADHSHVPLSTLIAFGAAPGNGPTVVADNGDIFFATTRGIGQVSGGQISNFYGNVFESPFITPNRIEGLTYDRATNQLVFGERILTGPDAGKYQINFLAIPEPVSAVLMLSAGLGLRRRRR